MNNSLKLIICLGCFILLFRNIGACFAAEVDVSKWSYDDLIRTACEMVGDKNYEGALKFFDLAVHASPNNPEAYINRGAMLGILHQKEKAIQDEQRALSLARSGSKRDIDFQSSAHENLSGIYLNYKEFDKAEQEARTAAKINPQDPPAQERLGDILKTNGKPREALFYFKRAKELFEYEQLPKDAEKIDQKIRELQFK